MSRGRHRPYCFPHRHQFARVLLEIVSSPAVARIAAIEIDFIADLEGDQPVSQQACGTSGFVGGPRDIAGSEIQPVDHPPAGAVEKAAQHFQRFGCNRSGSLAPRGGTRQFPFPGLFARRFRGNSLRRREVAILALPARTVAQIAAQPQDAVAIEGAKLRDQRGVVGREKRRIVELGAFITETGEIRRHARGNRPADLDRRLQRRAWLFRPAGKPRKGSGESSRQERTKRAAPNRRHVVSFTLGGATARPSCCGRSVAVTGRFRKQPARPHPLLQKVWPLRELRVISAKSRAMWSGLE